LLLRLQTELIARQRSLSKSPVTCLLDRDDPSKVVGVSENTINTQSERTRRLCTERGLHLRRRNHQKHLITPTGCRTPPSGLQPSPRINSWRDRSGKKKNRPLKSQGKRIAVLSPVAWRTPPRQYGAWETVASNITEGLVARGWEVTLFATGDSITKAHLHSVVPRGYEEDRSIDPKVAEYLHISELFEHASQFDLIHSHYDFMALAYSRLIETPVLTTVHGLSSPQILPVYQKYRDGFFVSVSDSDRIPGLNYLATVYNGIDLSLYPFNENTGDSLVFLGRIHPDKGVHLAIEVARLSGRPLIIAGIIQDKKYFEQQVEPHLDGHNISFIGSLGTAEKNELFGRAVALLHLNTIPERFGLVLAEANAAGVPVIARDLGSCREVIEDGKTGFLVSSVQEAHSALEKLPRINRLHCRERVTTHFSINSMVTGYEQVYSAILSREM